jgi:N-acyl-D-amino-acid deacylase
MNNQYLFAAILAVGLAGCESAQEPFLAEYDVVDLLIENGQVLDGLGNVAIEADVVVVGDQIVFVGEAAFSAADRENRINRIIDAAGRTVAPGFIDLHSHGDPLETPELENFLAMGVTTITLGQDGSSPDVRPLSNWLADVAAKGIGTNLAMFIGHGTIRDQSGIGMSDSPEPEDMQRMLGILDDALGYTFGLSSGLEYNPGLNAKTSELRALAKVVGQHNRIVMSHMRNEDDDQLEASIAELLEQGEDTRVHVSHLKSVYGNGPDRAEEILGILDAARASGINVTAEIYPYTASYTGIDIVFPVWAKTQQQFDVAKLERRDELAEFLRDRVNRRNGPEATLLGTDPWTGKTLADVAHEMEMPFEDVLIDVIGPQGASGAYFVMNDPLQARLLQDPNVGVCSDGSPTGFHPRGHGTFAKIIETYVNDQKTLTLPDAVRKMTSFAAYVLGTPDRGAIKASMMADIIIFDQQNVRATATYPDPLQLADGFDIVIVNGKVARENGRRTDMLHGRVLKPE